MGLGGKNDYLITSGDAVISRGNDGLASADDTGNKHVAFDFELLYRLVQPRIIGSDIEFKRFGFAVDYFIKSFDVTAL